MKYKVSKRVLVTLTSSYLGQHISFHFSKVDVPESVGSKGGSARLSSPLYGGVCLRGTGEPRLLVILVVTSTFTSENGAVVSDRSVFRITYNALYWLSFIGDHHLSV